MKAEFLMWVHEEAIKDAREVELEGSRNPPPENKEKRMRLDAEVAKQEAALARKYMGMAEDSIACGAGSCEALLADLENALEVHCIRRQHERLHKEDRL